MERKHYLEMMKNLKRLSDIGMLRPVNGSKAESLAVYLFAHCEATMELADELLKMGIKPLAILDNNPDKYGLEYKEIPVCAPSEAVKSDILSNIDRAVNESNILNGIENSTADSSSDNAIILIVSRFYEQMASQMRGLGFKGHIEKLTDYNTYAEYSLSPDTLIRKSERLNRGLKRLKRIKAEYLGRFIVFCPFPALGDIYFCMSYLKPYLDVIVRKECLVCVVGNAQKQVVELFNYAKVLKFEQNDIDEAIQAVIYTNDQDCYIAHHDRPYVVDLQRALYKKCIPLETIYKCGVFGLSQDTEPVLPVNWKEYRFQYVVEDSDNQKYSTAYEYLKGTVKKISVTIADNSLESAGVKTAIISPYAKSVVPLPESLWTDMVDDLVSSGYQVFTNVFGEEKPLDGTKPISPKIAEMKSVVEQAGLFIGIRSGMCDVIKTADCKKIALYPDYYYCDTKWKSIDIYSIEEFENIVVKDGDTWEEVKRQINL